MRKTLFILLFLLEAAAASLRGLGGAADRIPSLPAAVEFLGLFAGQEELSVVLNWSTATETQNQGFILERKTDPADEWQALDDYLHNDALLGQGTVSTLTEYAYTDTAVSAGLTYHYRLSGIDNANNIGRLDSVSLSVVPTSLQIPLPAQYSLKAAPNPFNPGTDIALTLPAPGFVEVCLYDLRGTKVGTLCRGLYEPGGYVFHWDAGGRASGVYVCLLRVDGRRRAAQKMTVLK
ncbi:MAG: hypothetical protein JXR21_00655 [Candidatus Marinimicrobia bacterium]|nr:hypothetical protein [Candidatus Neomarinimicrobiota bacterium]